MYVNELDEYEDKVKVAALYERNSKVSKCGRRNEYHFIDVVEE